MTALPFDKKKEFDVAGNYNPFPYAYGMGNMVFKKYNSPITPKENFFRMMNHEPIEWMPDMMTDFNFIQPMIMPDAYARAHGGKDWFGIDWKFEPMVGAAMVAPKTRRLSSIENWEKELIFPDLNAVNWEKDYNENYAAYMDADRATCFVIVNGLFERTADLTSFEDTFCYLLEEPEILEEFYNKLTDWHIELMTVAKKYYHADLITFHDDMGSQNAPFMSRNTFKEIMLPHYSKLTQAAHAMGLLVNFHSCGNVGSMIDLFCECGFDMWEGQNNCTDTFALAQKYSDKIAFLNAFKAMPDMNDEDYYNKIKELITLYAPTGRIMFWLQDQRTEKRSFSDDEAIYCLSREFLANGKF